MNINMQMNIFVILVEIGVGSTMSYQNWVKSERVMPLGSQKPPAVEAGDSESSHGWADL